MAHSKRNTSLAFFTAHERAQLKSHWGTQSTRLTRDSFLPLPSCTLCLRPAVSPVACSTGGELFCRECAVSNLLAQRKEIKRVEKEWAGRREREREEEEGREGRRGDARVRVWEEGGVEGGVRKKGDERLGGRGGKRKRDDDDDGAVSVKTSFWIPSQTPSTGPAATSATAPKLHPLCPGSTASAGSGAENGEKVAPHPLSLKGLVEVHFRAAASRNGDDDGKEGRGGQGVTYECPSCSRALSNASGGVVAVPCGCVVCKACMERFGKDREEGGDGGAVEEGTEGIEGTEKKKKKEVERCVVCEGELRGEGKGWVVLGVGGTGFAGGGGNMVKARGTAFQC